MQTDNKGYVIKIQKAKTTSEMMQMTANVETQVSDIEKLHLQQQKAINTALLQTGKNFLMEGIRSFGTLTGDTTIIDAINTGVGLASDVGTIVAGGWVGIITVASKYALEGVQRAVQSASTNKTISFNNQLLGQISKDGSRYY